MKRVAILVAFTGALCLAQAAGESGEVTARCGFALDHGDHGPGYGALVIDVTVKDGNVTGWMQWAAEEEKSARYPATVVRVPSVQSVTFDHHGEHTIARLVGPGTLDSDKAVTVIITAKDGEDHGDHDGVDWTHVVCKDSTGKVVYDRKGTIETGNIHVKHGK